MTIRLTTQGATATAIIDIDNITRRCIIDKRSFNLDEIIAIMNEPSTSRFGKIMYQMITNDPANSSSVNVSVINGRMSADVEDILDSISAEQDVEDTPEEEPNYEDVIDPDTENFS